MSNAGDPEVAEVAGGFRFRIVTFVTDSVQYAEMKRTFEESGFCPERCCFVVKDNRSGNCFEPYTAINEELSISEEPYIIFCHQDVRLDRGDGYGKLVAAIEELDLIDKQWAVAGNAGGDMSGDLVLRISDPHVSDARTHVFPRRVLSLDENFLLVKRDGVSASVGLHGFHLYGSDLCLNAYLRGRSSYVVDFHLSHLSPGLCDSVYERHLEDFTKHWSKYFVLLVLRTTCSVVVLSRYKIIRKIMSRRRFVGIAMRISERVVRTRSQTNVISFSLC